MTAVCRPTAASKISSRIHCALVDDYKPARFLLCSSRFLNLIRVCLLVTEIVRFRAKHVQEPIS